MAAPGSTLPDGFGIAVPPPDRTAVFRAFSLPLPPPSLPPLLPFIHPPLRRPYPPLLRPSRSPPPCAHHTLTLITIILTPQLPPSLPNNRPIFA